MILIPEIAAATFLLGFWMKGRFKSNEINDGSYPYQNIRDWQCPKCGLNWDSSYGKMLIYKYCECVECSVGHFHRQCIGERNNADHDQCGCHFSFIMRAKS